MAYTVDGERVEYPDAAKAGKDDRRVNQVSILPFGNEPLFPPLSARALERRRQSRLLAATQTILEGDTSPTPVQTRNSDDRAWLAKEEDERQSREHNRKVTVFQGLCAAFGDEFIDALNAIIASEWQDVKVMVGNGAGQDVLRACPVIVVLDGVTTLHSTGTPRRIETPVSIKRNPTSIRGKPVYGPIWAFPEWRERIHPRLEACIEEYTARLPVLMVERRSRFEDVA